MPLPMLEACPSLLMLLMLPPWLDWLLLPKECPSSPMLPNFPALPLWLDWLLLLRVWLRVLSMDPVESSTMPL